jgi:glucose/arabinose dehydrogenase
MVSSANVGSSGQGSAAMWRCVIKMAAVWGLAIASPAQAANVSAEVLAQGLAHPWAVAFIDDDTMLVTERPGRLRVVHLDGTVSEPVAGLPAIESVRQGGLLDLIADAEFASNRMVYFCYTKADPTAPQRNSTALASARLSADMSELLDVQELFVQTPTHQGGFHFGCRIVDRGDGTLWLGLGDRFQLMQAAQDKTNYIGKVVRISKDGSAAPGNPFADDPEAAAAIWSYGHRNIQGATLDAAGRLWMTEHGPQGGDELNLIEPGVNYGWPVITYGENYGGGQIGQGLVSAPGMAQPLVDWTPSIAPSGLAFLDTDRYGPQWRGSLLAGSLKFGNLVRIGLDGATVISQEVVLPDFGQRVRDVRLGPDGLIYLLTDSPDGQLLRLVPQ